MKKFKKILIVIPILTIIICSLCIPVSAVTNFYDVDFAISRPQVSDNVAYLEIVSQDGSNFYSYVVLLTMYTITAKETSELRSCDFILTFTGESDFIIGTGDADFYCSAVEISQDGDMYSFKPAISQSFFYPGHIVSIIPYGNIRLPNNLDDYNIGKFVFNYGTDTVSQNLLASILSVLENQSNSDITGAINSQTQQQHQDSQNIQQNANQNAEDIMNNADSNAEDIQQNQDKNAQNIQQNQDKNTQNIIDNQNQIVEQEKNEVTSSGNDSVDSVTNAIPQYNLIETIKVFVDSMGSTDTVCKFDVPEIYIPAFSIIPRTTLYSGGTFDFHVIIQMIPEIILTLVRYVLTAALILFSFKEFYNLIFNGVDGISKIGDDV